MATISERIKAAEQEIEDLKAEREDLLQKLKAAAVEDPSALVNLKRRIGEIPAFISSARLRVAALIVEHNKEELAAVQAELSKLRPEHEKKTAAYQSAREEWQEISGKFNRLDGRRSALESRVEFSETQLKTLIDRAASKAAAA